MGFQITEKVLSYELGSPGKPAVICSVIYPLFKGRRSKRINLYCSKFCAVLKRFCQNRILPRAEIKIQNGFNPIKVNLSYKITTNDDSVLSFYFDLSHGRNLPYRFSSNWNVKNGFPLQLKRITGTSRRELVNIVAAKLEENISNGRRIYYTNYKKHVIKHFHPDNYVIDGNKVYVFYQPGTLAPPVEGLQIFALDNNEGQIYPNIPKNASLRNSVLHIVKPPIK